MHVTADFLLQDNCLSKLKATKFIALLAHVGIYTTFFIVFSPLILGFTFMQGLVFSLINGGTHLVVDFFTSKLKRIYWHKSEARYVAVVTFDHAIHISILIATYIYMYPKVLAIL